MQLLTTTFSLASSQLITQPTQHVSKSQQTDFFRKSQLITNQLITRSEWAAGQLVAG